MKILFFKEGRKMFSKRKKIFVLVSMVLLLVVTGFLNVYFNKTDSGSLSKVGYRAMREGTLKPFYTINEVVIKP